MSTQTLAVSTADILFPSLLLLLFIYILHFTFYRYVCVRFFGRRCVPVQPRGSHCVLPRGDRVGFTWQENSQGNDTFHSASQLSCRLSEHCILVSTFRSINRLLCRLMLFRSVARIRMTVRWKQNISNYPRACRRCRRFVCCLL